MKGISKEDFLKNCLGELSNNSSQRRTHDCYGTIIQQFTSEGCLIDLSEIDIVFSRTKTFCFENSVFLTLNLGMREGVSEDSRGRNG